MPAPREIQIHGRTWAIGYFPPAQALPVFGRLLAFLGPALEGAAGEAVKAIVARLHALDLDSDLGALLGDAVSIAKAMDWPAVVHGAFVVGWGSPAFGALVRDLLAQSRYKDGPAWIPASDYLEATDGPLAGPEGTETQLRLVLAVVRSNFALPFFSRTSAAVLPPPASPTPAP